VRRVAPIALLAAVLAGCGGKSHTIAPAASTSTAGAGPPGRVVAIVGHTRVNEAQVAALMAFTRARALEEGEPFPPPGSAQYAAVRRKTISTLVTLVEYEQKASSLGIRFTRQAIITRAQTIESEGAPQGKDPPEVQYAKLLLARLGLVRDGLFTYVSQSVSVTPAEIRAYFEQNRSFYDTFPAAKKTIRDQVLAVKRNKVASRFFLQLPKQFHVTYVR
jgi:hypothetical protein